jgi:hypothetical protein
MEIRIETVVNVNEMLADGTAWLAVDYDPGHQGDELTPPEPARYLAEVIDKTSGEVLWAGCSETSIVDAISHLAPPMLPSVTGTRKARATRSEFDVDAALEDGGTVTITREPGRGLIPDRIIATVLDHVSVEIGRGMSTTAIDALSNVQPLDDDR